MSKYAQLREEELGDAVPFTYDDPAHPSAPLPPPAPVADVELASAKRSAPGEFTELSEEEARAALERHAKQRCCLRSDIAHELQLESVESESAVHMVFETSTEQRSTKPAHVPHPGGPVDGPHNGVPPGPWQMHATPTALFRNERRQLEVPHTSAVVDCFDCARRGTITCKRCRGDGRRPCDACRGSRQNAQGQRCMFCQGTGTSNCGECSGQGFITCGTCGGNGLVRRYACLEVAWKLNKQERVVGDSSLPEALIRQVSGITLFQEEEHVLAPIHHLPQAAVNSAANELMARGACPPTERLLRQRMIIRAIPVYRVRYRWQDEKLRTAHVYGSERAVFEKDYPTVCTGCVIL
jgi:hypothetical protein